MEYVLAGVLFLVVLVAGILWRTRAARRESVATAGGAANRDARPAGIAKTGIGFILGWIAVSLIVGIIPVLVALWTRDEQILAFEVFYLTLLVAAGLAIGSVTVIILTRLFAGQK